MVAAWAPPNSGLNKKGKMAFIAKDRASLGESFEKMDVVSILGIMENGRRQEAVNNNLTNLTNLPPGGRGR